MSMTATAQWAALPDHSAEIARVREEFITAYGYEPDGVFAAMAVCALDRQSRQALADGCFLFHYKRLVLSYFSPI